MVKKQETETEKLQKQFDKFDEEVKEMTLDRMNMAPKQEKEQQTKLSSDQIDKSNQLYLKPRRQLGPGMHPKTGEREKFNEKFREDYEFQKQYVNFIAENNEIIGESIEMWIKKFPGTNCEEWVIPTNKPVWAPRYVAEEIKSKTYHRLTMTNQVTNGDEKGNQYYGTMAVDNTIQRLDARPVSSRKSVFMGANSF